MPITPIHITFNLTVYSLASLIFPIPFLWTNLLYLTLADLIDLDHLTAKPIYKQRRNSLKTHLFHKNWIITSTVAITLLPFYPLTFIGIGLLSHLFLDWAYTKYWLKM